MEISAEPNLNMRDVKNMRNLDSSFNSGSGSHSSQPIGKIDFFNNCTGLNSPFILHEQVQLTSLNRMKNRTQQMMNTRNSFNNDFSLGFSRENTPISRDRTNGYR